MDMQGVLGKLQLSEAVTWNMIFVCWLIALTGTAGSLFFSEVLNFPPCVLCWYQRIFLYPLVLVFMVGMVRKEITHLYYALPISLFGLIIAIYHNLLFYGFISKALSPCSSGVSCSEKYIEGIGFISIPFLSAVSFFLIVIVCAVLLADHVQRRVHQKGVKL